MRVALGWGQGRAHLQTQCVANPARYLYDYSPCWTSNNDNDTYSDVRAIYKQGEAQSDRKNEYKIISNPAFSDYFSAFAHRPAYWDRNLDWAGEFGHQLILNTH